MPWKKTSCCLCLQICGLEVMVENNKISKLTGPGMVLLPQGFGLVFEGESVGVNVNQLTSAAHRDDIAGTPHHRRVPCRLEKAPG